MRTASIEVRAIASLDVSGQQEGKDDGEQPMHAVTHPLSHPPMQPQGRVGFIVPRYKHSAVDRNRLKRRLREIVRRDILPELGPRDVVVRALPAAYNLSFQDLQRELLQLKKSFSGHPKQ